MCFRRDRQTDRQTETERDRDRHTDRHTDTQTETETQSRETETWTPVLCARGGLANDWNYANML